MSRPFWDNQPVCDASNDRIHLPADGTAYEVDTTVNHTALNCSKVDRIHIVGVIKNV